MPHRNIQLIVIHCAATPNGVSFARRTASGNIILTSAQVIDQWHGDRKPPFQRRRDWIERFNPHLQHIGYHYVIEPGGGVLTGRHPDEMGAHAAGHNRRSLGICMLGTDAFTLVAWAALRTLVQALQSEHGQPRPVGHRDLSPDINGDGTIGPSEWSKTCPGFDVTEWWLRNRMQPMQEHVCEVINE